MALRLDVRQWNIVVEVLHTSTEHKDRGGIHRENWEMVSEEGPETIAGVYSMHVLYNLPLVETRSKRFDARFSFVKTTIMHCTDIDFLTP